MEPRYECSRNAQQSFSLLIFKEDVSNICSLVTNVPHQETGGNLFGLWTNNGSAVVLVATGPGENCKRSVACFYQDIPYMARVGHLLTQQYPLCHIGEWHSHHQLQLYKPSSGDCSTIRRNYPTGSQGFVLMIANIRQDGQIQLSPYKFTDDISPYQVGNIEVFETKNPFNDADLISSEIKNGKETAIPQEVIYSSNGHPDQHVQCRVMNTSEHSINGLRNQSRSALDENEDTVCTLETGNQASEFAPHPPDRPRETNLDYRRVSLTYNPHSGERRTTTGEGDDSATSENSLERERSLLIADSLYHRGEDSRNRYGILVPIYNTYPQRTTSRCIINDSNAIGPSQAGQLHEDTTPGVSNATLQRYDLNPDALQEPLDSTASHDINSVGPSQADHLRGDTSPAVSDATLQWYDRNPGVLQETIAFMETLSTSYNNHVNITRDKTTKELSVHFQHNYTKWEVRFQKEFPQNGKVQFSRHHDLYPHEVESSGNLIQFKNDFKKALSQCCPCWDCTRTNESLS